jgi:hypothetical protein
MGESTPLLPSKNNGSCATSAAGAASSSSRSAVSTVFVVSQVGLLTFFVFGAKNSDDDNEEYDVKQYIAFRDIMTMVSSVRLFLS